MRRKRLFWIFWGSTLGLCLWGNRVLGDAQQDRVTLLAGVTEIAAPGWPGCVGVFGPQAFVVITGKAGKNELPVVAATRLGAGRIVAFGHNGYFSKEAWETADTGRLMLNALKWLAGKEKPKIGIEGLREFREKLQEQGLEVYEIANASAEALTNCDVFVTTALPNYRAEQIAAVHRYVQNGGGLLTGDTAWGWLQLHPGKSLAQEHGGNQLLAEAGLVWTDGGLERTSKQGFTALGKPSLFSHAGYAWQALQKHASGQHLLSKEELAQACAVLIPVAHALPAEDRILRPQLQALQERYGQEALPRPDQPVTIEQPLVRLALALQLPQLLAAPPEAKPLHPAADFFPGAVPAQAPRCERVIDVDTSCPGWHSTGLYAPPGEIITIVLPEDVNPPVDLKLQIGCHTDRLWHLDVWKRCPEIVRRVALKPGKTKEASPFGGLLYFVVPDKAPRAVIPVRITGAVAAPYFVLGRTTPQEWRQEREAPAPWAELACANIILTVPAETIRGLENPVPLMDFWNHVANSCLELLGRPGPRLRPERYVADVQISAGYMHSGYPIMTHLDGAKIATDLERLLTKGSWGHFHELGHNHQAPEWTFEGTGEVTVNLFSLYITEHCCGLRDPAHPAISPEERERKTKEYFAAGAPFAKWKSDPFLALYMYMQLKEAFGWEAFRRVFQEYDRLPEAQKPKTEAEKRDQWLLRFSRAVGRNLGPFFTAWGVPTSESARQALQDLPVWLPEGFPPINN